MSRRGGTWALDSDTLRPALERWFAREPSLKERELVWDFLMDLTTDPYSVGRQDGDTGVWLGRTGYTLVVYVPVRERMTVAVVDINYE